MTKYEKQAAAIVAAVIVGIAGFGWAGGTIFGFENLFIIFMTPLIVAALIGALWVFVIGVSEELEDRALEKERADD